MARRFRNLALASILLVIWFAVSVVDGSALTWGLTASFGVVFVVKFAEFLRCYTHD